MAARVVIVDDDPGIRRGLAWYLKGVATVLTASTQTEALSFARNGQEAIFVDLRLCENDSDTDPSGLQLIRALRANGFPPSRVVVITGLTHCAVAVRDAWREGVADVLFKGEIDRSTLRQTLAKMIAVDRASTPDISEESPMLRVQRHVHRMAHSEAPVLIRGATGVGKERIARALHLLAPRAAEPFLALNCAAVPATLFESTVFGHERGAFTGANSASPGYLERAAGGTLFLDEVGELPLDVQAKLLRVLETKTYSRVGGRTEMRVHARIVTATNVDLERSVDEGAFRKDLYYRLSILRIDVPPLSDRRAEIPALVLALAREFGLEKKMTSSAVKWLATRDWPGNVRELKTLLERVATLCEADAISELELAQFADPTPSARGDMPLTHLADSVLALPTQGDKLQIVERAIVQRAIERAGGNKSVAATALGVERRVLTRRMSAPRHDKD